MKAAYFTLDIPTFSTEAESEAFYNLVNNYTVEFVRILEKGNRGLYLGIIRDESYLFAQDDGEGNVRPSIFEMFSTLNPIIIGVSDKDGVPFGQKYEVTYDEDGNILTEAYTGTPHFPINIPELMAYLPPINVYDVDGNLVSSTPRTEPWLPRIPAGWKKPRLDLLGL